MHRKYLFGSILFSLLMLFSLSQNKGQNLNELLKAYGEANAFYNKALKVNTESLQGEELESRYNRTALEKFLQLEKKIPTSSFDSLQFFLSLKIGELAHYFDSLPLALRYYKQAISLKSKLPALADSFIFRPYLFSGHIYFYQSQLDSAQYCFKKAELIQDHYANKIKENERLYNDLGVLHFHGGNYIQASNYFRKAAELLEKNNPYYNDLWVNYNINIAIALFKQDDYGKAYAILKGLLPFGKHLNEIHNNLGLIEQYRGNFREAIKEFRKVRYQNSLDIGLENDKASAMISLGQLDSARSRLDSALAKQLKYNATLSSVDHGLSFKIYGDLEKQLHHYIKALEDYQKALNQFYPSFRNSNIRSNPVAFSGVFSYIHLFHTLVAKAEVFHLIYQESHDISWIKEELKSYEASFGLVDYIEKVYQSDEARLFLEKSKYLIRDRPIDICFELYRNTNDRSYLEKAYELDQKNKATVLAFNEQRNQLIEPSSDLRKKEQTLKSEITRISIYASAVSDPSGIQQISQQIRDLEIRLNKIQESIEQIYPTVTVVIPKINYLQKQFLDSKTKLISYHLGGNKLSIFSITQSSFSAWQQDLYPGFPDDLQICIQELHSPSNNSVSPDLPFNRLSSFLLKGLLEKEHSRLIVIPDDQLSFLPFEALQEKNTYLAINFSVQYQYSTSLLKKEKIDLKKASTLSLAPFTTHGFKDSSMQLDPLLFSGEEIKGLEGKSFSGQQASKKIFLDQMYNQDIIHLATHAVASDSLGIPSYIVFAPWGAKTKSDYLLYSSEIYNLSMKNNKLIILSACETGHGKLIRGEGVMSMTRAFAYAGCPNIITSLWKADDEATAYLTKRIHIYLQKGWTVDRAIQGAKKDYLSDRSINPRRKQPAYWAHLVFIGNYKTAEGNFSLLAFLIGAIALMLLILLIIIRKRATRKES